MDKVVKNKEELTTFLNANDYRVVKNLEINQGSGQIYLGNTVTIIE